MENESTMNNLVDETEFDAAKKAAAKVKGPAWKSYTHKFSEPFAYENKTYEQLTFNWAKLTGKDTLAIESELMMLGKSVVAPEFSSDFKLRMAVRACEEGIPLNALVALPMADFNKILSRARTFLLKSGS